MISATTFTHETAKRIDRVFEARAKDRRYSYSKAKLADIVRQLVNEWLCEQEDEMGLGE
jgi:hypothetical protein